MDLRNLWSWKSRGKSVLKKIHHPELRPPCCLATLLASASVSSSRRYETLFGSWHKNIDQCLLVSTDIAEMVHPI